MIVIVRESKYLQISCVVMTLHKSECFCFAWLALYIGGKITLKSVLCVMACTPALCTLRFNINGATLEKVVLPFLTLGIVGSIFTH